MSRKTNIYSEFERANFCAVFNSFGKSVVSLCQLISLLVIVGVEQLIWPELDNMFSLSGVPGPKWAHRDTRVVACNLWHVMCHMTAPGYSTYRPSSIAFPLVCVDRTIRVTLRLGFVSQFSLPMLEQAVHIHKCSDKLLTITEYYTLFWVVYTDLSTCCALLFFLTRFSVSVGLDAAGKTTILYKLKLGEIVTTIPTIGKNHL